VFDRFGRRVRNSHCRKTVGTCACRCALQGNSFDRILDSIEHHIPPVAEVESDRLKLYVA
jgi:hypothetical protein